jgi:hypothetical protein
LSSHTETLTPASRAAEKSQVSTEPTPRRSDQELQLVRRIDWRFLLPEPSLRRVAYFGPETGTLPAALKHFSESLTIISPSAEAVPAQFDLVVLRLREMADLKRAPILLAPGGFLYWEMKPIKWQDFFSGLMRGPRPLWAAVETNKSGLSTVPHKPRVSTEVKIGRRGKGAGLQQNVLNLFRDHVGMLERLGFQDIQMHWLRPNFESCLEIIPMNDSGLDYTFSRTRSNLASRLKFGAGRVMMQTGLLAHLTSCFSLIAKKS